jgi:hypothetical protein
MGRIYNTNEEERNACRILVRKPEGKRQIGRSKRRYVDNNKMDLREIEWGGMDWTGMAQDRNTVMNLRVA